MKKGFVLDDRQVIEGLNYDLTQLEKIKIKNDQTGEVLMISKYQLKQYPNFKQIKP